MGHFIIASQPPVTRHYCAHNSLTCLVLPCLPAGHLQQNTQAHGFVLSNGTAAASGQHWSVLQLIFQLSYFGYLSAIDTCTSYLCITAFMPQLWATKQRGNVTDSVLRYQCSLCNAKYVLHVSSGAES